MTAQKILRVALAGLLFCLSLMVHGADEEEDADLNAETTAGPIEVSAKMSRWGLKFGPSVADYIFHSVDTHSTHKLGLGFHSHLVRRYKEWEVAISSYAHIGKLDRVKLDDADSRIDGRMYFRSLCFGPTLRYQSSLLLFQPNWTLFIVGGPVYAHQSFKSEQVTIMGGSYQPHEKITLESYGFIIGLGTEQLVPPTGKKQPFYYELSYKYLRGTRLARVGGTTTEQKILSREHSRVRLSEHTLILSLGIVLF